MGISTEMGLKNKDEYLNCSNPLASDSDGDGISDGEEAAMGLDLLSYDSDGDGMADKWEIANGTDPKTADNTYIDIDGDGYPVQYELKHGTSDNDSSSIPAPSLYVDASALQDGDGSAERPFSSIAAAVNAAEAYDIILVLPGRYMIGSSFSVNAKNLMIVSRDGPERTVIDYQKTQNTFYVYSVCKSSIIEGLSFENLRVCRSLCQRLLSNNKELCLPPQRGIERRGSCQGLQRRTGFH